MVKNLPLKLQLISPHLCVLLQWSSVWLSTNFFNHVVITITKYIPRIVTIRNSLFCPQEVCVFFYVWHNKYLLHVFPRRPIFTTDTDCVCCWRRELELYESIKLKSICRVSDDVHSQPHQCNTRYIFYTITFRNYVVPTRSVW